jgi:hypothetical protein
VLEHDQSVALAKEQKSIGASNTAQRVQQPPHLAAFTAQPANRCDFMLLIIGLIWG